MRLGMRMTPFPEAMGWDSWWFWKKAVSWHSDLGESSWVYEMCRAFVGQLVEIWGWTKRVDFWTWTRPVQFGLRDALHVVGSDGTVSVVKIVSLSSCRKPKSQEGNKSFVPELKKVVSVSGFLCKWTFYISVYSTYSYLGPILVAKQQILLLNVQLLINVK